MPVDECGHQQFTFGVEDLFVGGSMLGNFAPHVSDDAIRTHLHDAGIDDTIPGVESQDASIANNHRESLTLLRRYAVRDLLVSHSCGHDRLAGVQPIFRLVEYDRLRPIDHSVRDLIAAIRW